MTPRNKILLMVFFSILFVACKKSGITPISQSKSDIKSDTTGQSLIGPQLGSVDPALVGAWQLVSDSTSSYSQDVGTRGRKYIGTASDKFTFTSTGTAYIAEQAAIDTGSYGVNPDRSIEIIYPTRVIAGVQLGGSADYFKISLLDAHNAVLADKGWTPGGFYYVRIVTLTK